MKLDISPDMITGLLLEYAESHKLNTEVIREMNNKYDVGEPSEEEKVEFIREMLPLLPTNSYLTDLVMAYLNGLDTGEERNEMMKKVKSYMLQKGGLVTVYMIGDGFYIVSFDDENSEMFWGCGTNVETAIQNAAKEWDRYNHDDNPQENPFSQIIEFIQR